MSLLGDTGSRERSTFPMSILVVYLWDEVTSHRIDNFVFNPYLYYSQKCSFTGKFNSCIIHEFLVTIYLVIYLNISPTYSFEFRTVNEDLQIKYLSGEFYRVTDFPKPHLSDFRMSIQDWCFMKVEGCLMISFLLRVHFNLF